MEPDFTPSILSGVSNGLDIGSQQMLRPFDGALFGSLDYLVTFKHKFNISRILAGSDRLSGSNI